MGVCDSDDQDATHHDSILDAEQVSAQQVMARAMIVCRPRVGILLDRGHGRFDFIDFSRGPSRPHLALSAESGC